MSARVQSDDTPGDLTKDWFFAVEDGDIGTVRRLTAFHFPIDTTNSLGMTALHVAIAMNNTEMTTFLLTSGATLQKDNLGRWPSTIAALCEVNDELFDIIAEAEAEAGPVSDEVRADKTAEHKRHTFDHAISVRFQDADFSTLFTISAGLSGGAVEEEVYRILRAETGYFTQSHSSNDIVTFVVEFKRSLEKAVEKIIVDVIRDRVVRTLEHRKLRNLKDQGQIFAVISIAPEPYAAKPEDIRSLYIRAFSSTFGRLLDEIDGDKDPEESALSYNVPTMANR